MTTTTGGLTLSSTSSVMLPHARDVVSNSATVRTSFPHPFSDLVQLSRGSPRIFVAPPGASSILLVLALTTIFVYPMMMTKSMQLPMCGIVPPQTTTRTTMAGRCSSLRTWVGGFYLCADGRCVCSGELVVFGGRCMTFLYSRACSESISVLAHLSDGCAHITGGQNLSFFVRLFFMPSC